MRRAVFLDRDGVLNRTAVRENTPHPPASVDELEILPGVLAALRRLAEQELLLIVVTNQPDVARGTQTRAIVEQINRCLAEQLPLDAVYTCYHDTSDNCNCRKPRPGMLLEAAQSYQIDLAGSFMVGDRWSDIAAGSAAGCVTFLVDMPYSQRQRCDPDYLVASLGEAADWVLSLLHTA